MASDGQLFEPCNACGGEGVIESDCVVGYVTRDMASDAGEPSMEGMEVMGTSQTECIACEGRGFDLNRPTV